MKRVVLLSLVLASGCRFGFYDRPGSDVTTDGDVDGGPPLPLTVTLAGDGTGAVTSQPAGIDCPTSCSATIASTTVTLTATPDAGSYVAGWSIASCAGATTCTVDLAATPAVTVTFNGARNIVFVTSRKQVVGTLGGIAAADALCQTLADQANLPGSYIAMMSSTAQSLVNRLGTARGFVRPDGLPIADTVADLIGGTHWYPPMLDESRARVEDAAYAATGTASSGASGSTCSDYTTTTGNLEAARPHWAGIGFLSRATIGCLASTHLLCVGTSASRATSVTPTSGRTAFVTIFTPNAGLAGADAACASAATAAGKTGTFVAFLGTTTASAYSRLAGATGSWVRPDGVTVATSVSDFSTSRLVAPITLRASGAPAEFNLQKTWGGGLGPTQTATTTCTDWTDATLSVSGQTGTLGTDATYFYNGGASSCNQQGQIYCLEK